MNSERKDKNMSDQLSILSEARTWSEKVVADWRRFSSVLWRVPEGAKTAAGWPNSGNEARKDGSSGEAMIRVAEMVLPLHI
jgi:hypothetical protein